MNSYKKIFKSQLEYGKFGSHICTPVSSVFGYEFLWYHSIDNTDKFIDDISSLVHIIMVRSHEFYTNHHFSFMGKNLMISDLFNSFPSHLKFLEIAGSMKYKSDQSLESGCSKIQNVDNSFLICPLEYLLNHLLNKRCFNLAVLVTRLDHTVCYIFCKSDDNKGFYYFDPIEASLTYCSTRSSHQENDVDWFLQGNEYSGLIMTLDPIKNSHEFLQIILNDILV
jgi:hypothetical protein